MAQADASSICTWCDKRAFADLKGADGSKLPVCPDHYISLLTVENEKERNRVEQTRHAMTMMNQAAAEMDYVTGFGRTPRVDIPVPTPASNYNSISVENSTIGVISTAAVGEITAYIGHMSQADPATEALKQITSAVANAPLDEGARKDLLDQISVLAEQAAAEPAKRKTAVVAPVLAAIAQGAGAAKAVADAWTTVAPILKAHFGLS